MFCLYVMIGLEFKSGCRNPYADKVLFTIHHYSTVMSTPYSIKQANTSFWNYVKVQWSKRQVIRHLWHKEPIWGRRAVQRKIATSPKLGRLTIARWLRASGQYEGPQATSHSPNLSTRSIPPLLCNIAALVSTNRWGYLTLLPVGCRVIPKTSKTLTISIISGSDAKCRICGKRKCSASSNQYESLAWSNVISVNHTPKSLRSWKS